MEFESPNPANINQSKLYKMEIFIVRDTRTFIEIARFLSLRNAVAFRQELSYKTTIVSEFYCMDDKLTWNETEVMEAITKNYLMGFIMPSEHHQQTIAVLADQRDSVDVIDFNDHSLVTIEKTNSAFIISKIDQS